MHEGLSLSILSSLAHIDVVDKVEESTFDGNDEEGEREVAAIHKQSVVKETSRGTLPLVRDCDQEEDGTNDDRYVCVLVAPLSDDTKPSVGNAFPSPPHCDRLTYTIRATPCEAHQKGNKPCHEQEVANLV